MFLDTFEMSHTLDLGARLEAEPETLAAAELLLTKLQIAEVNAKDLSDTAMLLWDHEPADADGPGRLNLTPVAARCGADWGLYTTVTDNLSACADMLGDLLGRPGRPGADRGQDRHHHRRARPPRPSRWRWQTSGQGRPPGALVPAARGGHPVTMRIYFATDIHGSEVCWRKFLNAARFYEADTLILGGDVSGKAVVPVVARPGDGFLIRQFHGERVLTADETAQVETRIRDMGFYPYRTTDEELEEIWDDPEAVHAGLPQADAGDA